MSAASSIEWTDATWNPVRGCTRVSAGCMNCYAEGMAHRFSGPGGPYEGLTRMVNGRPTWTGKVRLLPELLDEPMRWAPRRVFVNSMSDLFHEGVPDEFIDRVFAQMAWAKHHTFQVLTKRAERMRDYCRDPQRLSAIHEAGHRLAPLDDWPLPNVQLGVSVEDQLAAGERIPYLLATPAAVRFLSCEPLLGPIDFNDLDEGRENLNALTGLREDPFGDIVTRRKGSRIDWVIVGGESGPKARPLRVEWVRSIVKQCRRAKVPVFVKQLGAFVVDRNDAGFDADEHTYVDTGLPVNECAWPSSVIVEHDINGYREAYQGADCRVRLRDRKGGDWSQWPTDLRVREFPGR